MARDIRFGSLSRWSIALVAVGITACTVGGAAHDEVGEVGSRLVMPVGGAGGATTGATTGSTGGATTSSTTTSSAGSGGTGGLPAGGNVCCYCGSQGQTVKCNVQIPTDSASCQAYCTGRGWTYEGICKNICSNCPARPTQTSSTQSDAEE